MSATLTVLGCDGSHAGAGGAGSGYLVRDWSSGTALWLDAGPGTFAALQQYCDPRRLHAVVLTHRHRDHCSDLDGFVAAARWTLGWRRDPLPVLAPAGVREQLACGDDDPDGEAAAVVAWHEVGDGQQLRIGPLGLRFSRTDHGPDTLATRLDGEGWALGYSADSGPGWSLRSLGPDLDLALCEATVTADHEGVPGHMSARQAGATARDARARRLVVTHRWPAVTAAAVRQEAEAAFGAPVTTAVAGHGYTL